jgi:hypothetical protein
LCKAIAGVSINCIASLDGFKADFGSILQEYRKLHRAIGLDLLGNIYR